MDNFREFNKNVVLNQNFLKLTDGAKSLYFILSMSANSMGVVKNREEILARNNSNQSDLDTLVEKGYILWRDNDDLIISHWYINNRMPMKTEDADLTGLRFDERRYVPTPAFKRHADNKNDDFEKLWSVYPKRQGTSKKDARRAFSYVSVDVSILIAAVERAKKTKQWRDVQYIPALAVWLNQRRWETEGEVDDGVSKLHSCTDSAATSKWNIQYDN